MNLWDGLLDGLLDGSVALRSRFLSSATVHDIAADLDPSNPVMQIQADQEVALPPDKHQSLCHLNFEKLNNNSFDGLVSHHCRLQVD